MAISFVGASSANATSITIPAGHEAGDLLMVVGFNTANLQPFPLDASWTQVGGANSASLYMFMSYKIATSSTETSGTWSRAVSLICHVYRGVNQNTVNSFPGTPNTGTSTSVAYPSLAESDYFYKGTGNWLAFFSAIINTNSSLATPPTGATLRTNNVGATCQVAGFDMNAPYNTNYSGNSVSAGGTSAAWITLPVAIVALPGAPGRIYAIQGFQ